MNSMVLVAASLILSLTAILIGSSSLFLSGGVGLGVALTALVLSSIAGALYAASCFWKDDEPKDKP